jgi:hypothetical protein
MTFSTELEKIILKIHMEAQDNESQSNPERKKSNARVITIHYFKLYYRTITLKNVEPRNKPT